MSQSLPAHWLDNCSKEIQQANNKGSHPFMRYRVHPFIAFDFRKMGERILLQLETGEVNKKDNGYTASGMLRGKRMVTQPNGNHKPMPLYGEDLKPFEVDINCR